MNNRIGKSNRGYCLATLLAIILAAAVGVGALLATPALAQTETILYSFTGTPDGQNPGASLIQDAAGNLYGVTVYGGVYGYGTGFELSFQNGAWLETILHSFGGPGDGGQPAGMAMDRAGNLYGAANGDVYELTPDGQGNWTETILKTFKYPSIPVGCLTLDAEGRLYGAATGSLRNGCCGFIYRLSPPTKKGRPWKYLVLYSTRGFKHSDGAIPNGGLVFDATGNLYGTTELGGTYNYGAVFELSPGAKRWTEKVLYSFQRLSDGGLPIAGLVFDAVGNLYGTTMSGGNADAGTVFELSPGAGAWTETVLHSFTGLSDGDGPVAPVTLHNGSLYGTTACGGNRSGCMQNGGDGVVFELSPSGGGWTEQVLHTFTSSPDGALPGGGVIFDPRGDLYGVTGYGGTTGSGVVYKISQ